MGAKGMCDGKTVIKKISEANPEAVFVGGVAEVFHGIKKNFNDLDIKVLNLKGLDFIENLILFESNGVLSISKQRAYGFYCGFFIDIFIEENVPEYIEEDGVKYATLKDFEKHYERVIKESKRDKEVFFYKEKLKKIWLILKK